MDLVSIIIPVYNVEGYLEECIESVLNQIYNNIEVLIIDDGSTDNSKNIAIKYSNRDQRIKVFSQKNMGASVARNKGILKSKGKFIMFLDADDVLEKYGVEALYYAMIKNNCDIAIGDWTNIDEDNKLLLNHDLQNKQLYTSSKLYSTKEILNYSFFDPVPSNKMFKRNIIEDYNIRFAEVAIGQDLNFFLKYIAHCKSVYLLNKNIFKYRIRNGSISRTYSLKIKDITNSFDDIMEHYLANNKLNEYKNQLNSWKIHHLNWQINKIRLISEKEDRIKVINNFKNSTREILKDEMINNIERKNFIKLKIKYIFKFIYSSNTYCRFYRYMNRK